MSTEENTVPPLDPAILQANICNGFGLTQYKIMHEGPDDPQLCQPETDRTNITVRKMEAAVQVQVPVPSEQPKTIDIEDFLKFLKEKKIENLQSGVPLSLNLPPVVTDTSENKVVVPSSSPYAAGGEMEIFSENGTDFQQITFEPPGQEPKKVTLLFPVSMPRAAILRPQTPEEFAQSYIHMLGLQHTMEQVNKDTRWRNKLASLVFKCTMSLLLGYLYNHVKSKISDFSILPSAPDTEADELGMLIIQSEIDAGLFDESDYKTLSERLTFLKALFTKGNIVSPGLKTLFGIPSTADSEPEIILEHYETIFEMVYRLATKIPIKLDTDKWSYESILQNVCSKIYIILLNYDVITAAIVDKAAPIYEAIINLADTGDNATIFKRLKSIIVLGVAYNSYGWLFALVAPFAIPAAIGVTNWAICFLARLPFTAIKYAGTTTIGVLNWLASSGQPQTPFQPGQDGSLICVGHTITAIGALVPYMVSKNDIHALSRQLQHAKLEKPSLVSSLFDASGAAGLEMQSNDAPELLKQNAYKFLMRTHPIGNLIKCIDAEITDVTNSEVGIIKTLPEIAFSVFINTICSDEGDKNGLLISPVIQFCAEILHESLSGVRSGLIGTIRAIIDEGILGEGAIQLSNPSNNRIDSDSSVSSSCSSLSSSSSNASFETATSLSELSITIHDSTPSESTTPKYTIPKPTSIQFDLNLKKLEMLKRIKKIPKSFNIHRCQRSRSSSDVKDTEPSLPVSPISEVSEDFYNISVKIDLATKEMQMIKKSAEDVAGELVQTEIAINNIVIDILQPIRTDFIVLSVMDWIAEVTPPFRGGFKRHRNVPILAEIKQTIVKTGTGLFNAIKPRLVRVKGRKSKRFAPKKGTKKWRKRYGSRRGTKKVYRKRYNTHKKRK
jgi:hypothetical protein